MQWLGARDTWALNPEGGGATRGGVECVPRRRVAGGRAVGMRSSGAESLVPAAMDNKEGIVHEPHDAPDVAKAVA